MSDKIAAEPFYTRLLDEKEELEQKFNALTSFMFSEKYGKIALEQQNLLAIQLHFMAGYLEVLKQRLVQLNKQ